MIKYTVKKKLLIILFPLYCFSQDFNSGISLGISTSQVSGDQLSGFNKIGPRISLFLNRKINWYYLQLELQYISKGSKKNISNDLDPYIDNTYTSFINNYRFHVEYLGIPLSIQTKVKSNLLIETGTSINVLIKQKEEIDFYIDNSREVNKIEYCYFIGLLWNIYPNYYVNARISNSVFPIREHSSGQTYRFNKGQYNTTISFSLYYKI